MEEVACPEPCCFCGFPLQRKRSITATVLDVTGWRPVHHVVQRCGNRDCPRWRREVGYNFCQEGTMRCRRWFFQWSGATPMAFWFISGQCGFTVKYLRQLSRRLALQHLSFESEARVHCEEAHLDGLADMIPAKAPQKIMRGWILWRLVPRQSPVWLHGSVPELKRHCEDIM